MDQATLDIYDDSLRRCNARPGFLEKFYDNFLASSPGVREKFKDTNFVRQRRALRASLYLMVLAAEDEQKGPERYLREFATSHSKANYDIGAEYYDLWLDAILAAVREFDPEFSPQVEEAWESVMMVGIHYMLSHYNDPPAR